MDHITKKSAQMTTKEFTRWYAFMNGLKFINIGEEMSNKRDHDDNKSYNALMRYIDLISGDINSYIKHWNGVPYKYSLDMSDIEARQIEDIKF